MNILRSTSAPLLRRPQAVLDTWKQMLVCTTVGVLLLSGCRTNSPDDATLARSVQTSLNSDTALNGLAIQAGVQGGVVTLSGNAQNDAQRTLAARDASAISGIRQVVNNVLIAPVTPAAASTAEVVAPAPIPAPAKSIPDRLSPESRKRQRDTDQARETQQKREQQAEKERRMQNHETAPVERSSAQPGSAAAAAQPTQPAPQTPQPVLRDITVPAGYALAVRVTQTIDSTDAQQGQTFSGVVANNVMADGLVAIPAGTHVSGTVNAVQEAGHFEGNSLLTISLTSISRRGETLPVATQPYTVQGKGRGKNTLEKTGGGAAVGAILGGIFGGGKGAAIGAAAGGGVGAGSNAITRGEQVQIASESVVRFRLTGPIAMQVRADGQDSAPDNPDPTLQHHPPQ